MRLVLAAVALMLFSSGGALPEPATSRPQRLPRLASLPDNPCEVLTRAQVSAISGLDVTAVRRVPSIAKIVQAQRDNREPKPGTICSYETGSDFGAIMLVVPARADRTTASYWEARSKYFATFPGSAQPVGGLGVDAWLAGGAGLQVLVRQDEYFSLSTQMYQRQSRELLINIARVVIDQL